MPSISIRLPRCPEFFPRARKTDGGFEEMPLGRASDVQAPRVATLVDQLDVMNPARTPSRLADVMHQPEEHGRVDVQRPGPAETRFAAQMQHHEAFVGQPYEHRDTQRPT